MFIHQHYPKRLLLLGFLLLGGFLSLIMNQTIHAAGNYLVWSSSPEGNVGITTPEIQKKIRFENYDLQSYSMTLNGENVPVIYDSLTERFTYTPAQELAAGIYEVHLTFQFTGFAAKEYNWDFTVVPHAVTVTNDYNPGQLESLDAVNAIRRQLGLGLVSLDSRLNLSAAAHAQYQDSNGSITHNEIPGKAGFTGSTLADRIAYFGYANDAAAEDISQQNHATATQAVDDLFDAPYHRIPFLDPDLKEIGYGNVGSYHVILFGMGSIGAERTLITSPASGETGVPTKWNGHEIPDPLRFHADQVYPVGYPIMAMVNGLNIERLAIVEAELTNKAGESISLLNNGYGNGVLDDKLQQQVLFIPTQPLLADTEYRMSLKVRVVNKDESSALLSQIWSFTTEALPGSGKKLLHTLNSSMSISTPTIPAIPIGPSAPYVPSVPSSNVFPSPSPIPGIAERHVVKFKLDDNYYTLDQIKQKMIVKPVIREGFAYLAIRDLEQALMAEVEWDDTRKAAIYMKNNNRVLFYINQSGYEKNDGYHSTNTPALLVNGDDGEPRTIVPVRLLADLLDSDVDYDEPSRTVTITYPKK